ncbi:hypothetical protein H6P81_015933 [Aristolochia fimbriata]|uniref:Dof zinc finger protein n=1 Tax=Aristolochia fimbriata TaxID=158543 RepID=A0AAV7E6Z0_ARIFI|nr:hypothetical protein H6P81_015933 [Aristolochia fimbriata]
MVFPSVPVYLDPPNWQQQQINQHHHQGGDNLHHHHHHHHPPPPPPPPPPASTSPGGGGGGTAGSIRPGSMADRARLAKLPQPEAALKCPRCESTNTKFCYFNNYSLSQPRHFCKTCRRYWTRGGALRNVPVGGGCRRNKRSKGGNSSKSPAPPGDRQTGSASAGSAAVAPNSTTTCTSDVLLGHHHLAPPQLPFNMAATLHHLTDYAAADIGLNFAAGNINHPSMGGGGPATPGSDMDFQMGGSILSGGGGGSGSATHDHQQWRSMVPPQLVQQFPFLTGLEAPPALYPFDQGEEVEHPYGGGGGGVSGGSNSHLRAKLPPPTSVTQMAPVKVEGSSDHQGLNLPRHFLGINSGNDQYWGSNAWSTDLSGFNSSSSSHML